MKELDQATGWEGPSLESLLGRDITVNEKGEERRGPIVKTEVTRNRDNRYTFIQFRVGWTALREAGFWRLESEPDVAENGTFAFGMNPEYISPRVESSGEIICGKNIIHKEGDTLQKPEIPTNKPRHYFYGE